MYAVPGLMLVAGLAALFGSALPDLRAARALAEHGRPTSGTITAVFERRKASDRYAEYAYVADGAAYKGRIDGYQGAFAAKGPIALRYLPERPDYSSPDPEGQARQSEADDPASRAVDRRRRGDPAVLLAGAGARPTCGLERARKDEHERGVPVDRDLVHAAVHLVVLPLLRERW